MALYSGLWDQNSEYYKIGQKYVKKHYKHVIFVLQVFLVMYFIFG